MWWRDAVAEDVVEEGGYRSCGGCWRCGVGVVETGGVGVGPRSWGNKQLVSSQVVEEELVVEVLREVIAVLQLLFAGLAMLLLLVLWE